MVKRRLSAALTVVAIFALLPLPPIVAAQEPP